MDLVTASGILLLSLLILGPRIGALIAIVVAISLAYVHEKPVPRPERAISQHMQK